MRKFVMIKNAAPMSNAERQRRFRARNPGYNRKYNRHPTADQRHRARQAALEAVAKVEAHMQQVLHCTLCKPLPLMLPAPVETLILPGMNTIGMIRTTERVPLARAA
jgi:hypothetical protein